MKYIHLNEVLGIIVKANAVCTATTGRIVSWKAQDPEKENNQIISQGKCLIVW